MRANMARAHRTERGADDCEIVEVGASLGGMESSQSCEGGVRLSYSPATHIRRRSCCVMTRDSSHMQQEMLTVAPADSKHHGEVKSNHSSSSSDFTLMPKLLDAKIEKHSPSGALRSTIIKSSDSCLCWRQKNLLSSPERRFLKSEDLKSEKEKAFDLLDALSRSGSLPVDCSELHVVISMTHCFDKDVMDTIVQDNINPIEQLEMSALLVASTIHGISASGLIKGRSEVGRLAAAFPSLMSESATTSDNEDDEGSDSSRDT